MCEFSKSIYDQVLSIFQPSLTIFFLFLVFSDKIFPRLRQKNAPLSQENGNAHAAPLCIRVGGGGGGARTSITQVMDEWVLRKTNRIWKLVRFRCNRVANAWYYTNNHIPVESDRICLGFVDVRTCINILHFLWVIFLCMWSTHCAMIHAVNMHKKWRRINCAQLCACNSILVMLPLSWFLFACWIKHSYGPSD